MSTIAAWQRFLESGELGPATGDRAGVRGVIAESWARSYDGGIAADDLDVPRVDVDRDSLFTTVAVPVVLGMADLLTGSAASIALTDHEGTVAWRWDSDKSLTRLLDQTEVAPGCSLTETGSGTNGIGIASQLRRPALVIGAEHYKRAWHRWACAAAPVFSPATGRMVGVVNVACRAQEANPLLQVVARSIAHEVEATLRVDVGLPEQRLLEAHLRRRRLTRNAVITVSSRTLIVDDDGLRLALNHADLWDAVRSTGPTGGPISLGGGVTGNVRGVQPGSLAHGATIELSQEDDQDARPRSRYRPQRSLSELERAEYRVIRDALARNGANRSATAEELGISRGTLYQRIRRYGL